MPIQQALDRLTAEGVSMTMRIVGGCVVFLAFLVAAALCRALVHRLGKRSDRLQQPALQFIAQLVNIGLLTLATVTALGTMGVNVSALVAGLGLTGFALGFALKDAISNLLAGVLILLYRPFRHRDHIAVAGYEGTVTGLDLRYTTLRQDDRTFLIPNSLLFTNPVTVVHPSTSGQAPSSPGPAAGPNAQHVDPVHHASDVFA